ncbi:MAG TPA: glycoside hydrolase family 25 protein [Candidatus Fournierella merdigallinarum]|nr:glycoside hydrolase family 25 protein [Candidatus Fournierella merdigallinarum]
MEIYQTGIDVSRYQGIIDWQQVAAGKQFAIVRAASSNSGGVYVDPYFEKNIADAKAAGLRVGVYYYTYARTEDAVINELDVVLAALEGLKLEYPVFVDVEASSLQSLGRAELTRLVRFAMDILDQKGWYPGYYTYTNFIQNYLNPAQLAAYPLWIADYRGYVGYQGDYAIWQYSSTGRVNGISGNVDLNYSYKDFLPLIRAAGKNGYGQGPATLPLTGTELVVYQSGALYYYAPETTALAGTLEAGRYPALAVTDGAWNGAVWAQFLYGGGEYWAPLQAGATGLAAADGGDCEAIRAQLEQAQAKLELTRQSLDWLLAELEQ